MATSLRSVNSGGFLGKIVECFTFQFRPNEDINFVPPQGTRCYIYFTFEGGTSSHGTVLGTIGSTNFSIRVPSNSISQMIWGDVNETITISGVIGVRVEVYCNVRYIEG